MNPILATFTLPELTDLVRRQFLYSTNNFIKSNIKQVYITDYIGKGQGNSKRYTEIDGQTFAHNKREGDAAQKARIGVGYTKDMLKKRVAIEIDVTQEMLDENRYSEVGQYIKDISSFCANRIEIDGTHRFTFAGATSYVDMDGDTVDTTTGDGLSLINAAHALKYSSTTYSNRVSGDPAFSKAGLEAAERLTTTSILTNFGDRRVMNFNTIIVGDDPVTRNLVTQLFGSESDNTQSNSGVMNVYRNKYKVISLPWLATTALGAPDATKRQYWFLAATGQGFNGWQGIYGEWEAPHLKSPGVEDYHRDIWTWGSRAGYGFVTLSGRGIIGSLNAS